MPAWSHPTPEIIKQPNTKFSVNPDTDVMACLICLDKKKWSLVFNTGEF